jgi:hypothetical protein
MSHKFVVPVYEWFMLMNGFDIISSNAMPIAQDKAGERSAILRRSA